jgi:glycosyltransferase involved in cell wall biosynthesis
VIIQLGIPEEKISVVPNGVDAEAFFSVPREDAQKKIKLHGKHVILSIGRLTPNKGFDLLIKALRNLYTEVCEKDLYLAIGGEGGYRKELERLISSLGLNEYVRLVGEIPHQELYNWYSAADIFCLASEDEGWPNVVLESLACGTPVVATPVGGIPEIIRSNGIGLLTKRSEQDIAETISIALKKPWDRNEIAQYARQHTWDKVAQSVYDVFQSVLNSRHNHSITL